MCVARSSFQSLGQLRHRQRFMFLSQVLVTDRHVECLVAQQFLDHNQIHAREAKGMSQIMEAEIFDCAALQTFLKAS